METTAAAPIHLLKPNNSNPVPSAIIETQINYLFFAKLPSKSEPESGPTKHDCLATSQPASVSSKLAENLFVQLDTPLG